MMERDGYKPQLRKEAPFGASVPGGAGTPPGGDITRIERRLQELETETNRPTEYYLLDLQRRFARDDYVQTIEALRTSSHAWQMSPSFWARQHVDGAIIKSRGAGSKEAQQDMVSFSLALLAVSFPYHKAREQYNPHSAVCICIFRKIAWRAGLQSRAYL
jgi:hypothetical protein